MALAHTVFTQHLLAPLGLGCTHIGALSSFLLPGVSKSQGDAILVLGTPQVHRKSLGANVHVSLPGLRHLGIGKIHFWMCLLVF